MTSLLCRYSSLKALNSVRVLENNIHCQTEQNYKYFIQLKTERSSKIKHSSGFSSKNCSRRGINVMGQQGIIFKSKLGRSQPQDSCFPRTIKRRVEEERNMASSTTFIGQIGGRMEVI